MTPEGRIRAYLKRQCKASGLEHRKLGWIGRRNAPDEFVFRPDSLHPVCAFIECKAPGEVPTGGQLREISRLRDAGFQVYVVDCELMVDLALRQLRLDTSPSA